jgi:putative transposase
MSLPRQVLPGRTYMLTRRCSERRFFLRPSKRRDDAPPSRSVLPRPGLYGEENETYLFNLGHAATTNAVDLLAAIAMGNHAHENVHDPEGTLPKFAQQFHSNHARAMNVLLRRRGSFWDAGDDSYSAVWLVDAMDVLKRQVYLITNAVAAGLVARPEDWPGVCILPCDIGKEFVVARPRHFFRSRRDDATTSDVDAVPGTTARERARRRAGPRECLPDFVRFRFVKPPEFAHLTDEAYVKLLQDAVDEHVREIHAGRKARGERRPFVGADAIMAQSTNDSPETVDPDAKLNPRVACKDRWKRAERLQALVEFWQTHRVAYLAFRSGKRRTLFPPGTWGAVKLYGARAAPPPS